jgi:hypothetical protein
MLLGSFRTFLPVLTVREPRELPAILLPGIFAHADSYGGMPTHVMPSLLTQRKPPVGRVTVRITNQTRTWFKSPWHWRERAWSAGFGV